MLFDEALQYLLSLGHETIAIKLGLANIARVLQALDYPLQHLTKVQIAGTNGKGSTAVMLDAICRAARIRTGLYTSPHLISITERIRLDGQEISPENFARGATVVRETAQSLLDRGELAALPTFFEQVTAIALLAFASESVELAILETGLGGRLDATTAAEAQLVALTPIALDHQEYLGDTLAEIAAEKAAIIRPHTTAVIAPQAVIAREVIFKRCEQCNVAPRYDGCSVEMLGAEDAGRMRVNFRTKRDRYENVLLGLRGRHQMTNAALAINLAEALRERGFQIPRAAIIEGLTSASHAGRLELRKEKPSLLFDGAHNPAGARALRAYLDEFVVAPITLIFGAMRDKDLQEIAATLFPIAHRLILTQPTNPRAAETKTLAQFVSTDFDSTRITLTPAPATALGIARDITPPDGIICITGSLYLVGEIQKIMSSKP